MLNYDRHGHVVVSLELDKSGDRAWVTEATPGALLAPMARLDHLGGGTFRFRGERPDTMRFTGRTGTEANLLTLVLLLIGGTFPLPPL